MTNKSTSLRLRNYVVPTAVLVSLRRGFLVCTSAQFTNEGITEDEDSDGITWNY